jgi:hypothetical protein
MVTQSRNLPMFMEPKNKLEKCLKMWQIETLGKGIK